MIYSFDGGSKKSYEKMRPGRFKKIILMRFMKTYLIFIKLKKN